MLGWHKETTADTISRRIAALKDEMDDLQSALRPKADGLQRMASEARDWIAERAEDLPRVRLPDVHFPEVRFPGMRRHVRTPPASLAVIAAAVVVGAGVGCVLYALTSGSKRRPSSVAPGGGRRPASEMVQ